MSVSPSILSVRLREAMSRHQLTQAELANAVGCSAVAIGKILSGQTHRSRLLPPIAAVLGVGLEWLRGDTGSAKMRAKKVSELCLPSETALRRIFEHLLASEPKKASPAQYASHLAEQLPKALTEWRMIQLIKDADRNGGSQTANGHGADAPETRPEFTPPSLARSFDIQPADISMKLVQAMLRQDVSQKKLARIVGCSQVTISRILSGDIAHSRWLPEVATALEIDYASLTHSQKHRHALETSRIKVLIPDRSTLSLRFYTLLLKLPDDATCSQMALILAKRLPSILGA